jgi:D-alanyl-D-alanine carboxypeptidase/D-alanyl-D-alanine-endopeptidase (penicillin-binding protein 4)
VTNLRSELRRKAALGVFCLALGAGVCSIALARPSRQPRGPATSPPHSLGASQPFLAGAPSRKSQVSSLQSDLDRIFAEPVLSRALIGVRVESLRDGQVLYAHDDAKLVMPASNMKLLTMAAAAERLGWDFKYET